MTKIRCSVGLDTSCLKPHMCSKWMAQQVADSRDTTWPSLCEPDAGYLLTAAEWSPAHVAVTLGRALVMHQSQACTTLHPLCLQLRM